ncbi:hypothetical protein ADUPG1_001409, partial [Aduncisulcus paluster]
PETDFGAVFIPDTWHQAQLLIPHFFFHEADTLVFLGPELWSQALNSARDVEARNLRLTVAPGAWQAWNLSEGWTAETVNARINDAQHMDFSLAPISWNAEGQASQKLYLFRPEQNGKTRIDADLVSNTLAKAKARREARVNAWKEKQAELEAKRE